MSKKQDKPNLLIVDDNEELLIGLKMVLASHFNTIKTIKNPNIIVSELKQNNYDAVLLDMNFTAGINSGNEGLYWLGEILKTEPEISVILITAYSDTELAVKAIKKGATDFIEKSWDETKIISTVLSAVKLKDSRVKIRKLKEQKQHLSSIINKEVNFVVGNSNTINKVMIMAEKVATTDANVLILGENGTGKEVFARHIHNISNRKDEIFVKVDLGSLTETLFESELFGHKKGAFTDAKEDRQGRFEIASGGTIFLDEIGNVPLHLQAKLLSVLQNREVIPLGSQKPVPIDIRLICATNMDLEKMAAEGNFREDLLYRINTIQLDIPSLRDRPEDIPSLAKFFINQFAEKYQKGDITLSNSAIDTLKSHHWKGNIRELQHSIEKAIILSDNKILEESDFNLRNQISHFHTETLNLIENEKIIISKALEKFNRNISKTSRELGIDRSTLYDKIKKHGL